MFLTFYSKESNQVLGDTYESALFETKMVDTNEYDAVADQLLYCVYPPQASPSLIIEVVCVGLCHVFVSLSSNVL